jgi:hypothetical protein
MLKMAGRIAIDTLASVGFFDPDRNMSSLRDPRRYRDEAIRLRKAAMAPDSAELRASYLALATRYERLAQVLDKSADHEDIAVGVDAGLPEHRPPGAQPNSGF